MATAAQIVRNSLSQILVQSEEAPIEAGDAQAYVFALNNYMLALDAEGITLGYTVVDDLGDEITVPPGALRGIIYNMALEMAPRFGAPISKALENAAADGLKAMRRLGQRIIPSAYPSTLPVGSGNEGDSRRTRHFYPVQESLILAETSGPIAQESGTADAAQGSP